MNIYRTLLIPTLITGSLLVAGCGETPPFEPGANEQGHSQPSPATAQANQAVMNQRPFANRNDFEDALRGLIAQEPDLAVNHVDGGRVWDTSAYEFVGTGGEGAPASVNPSLWRQAALNNIHGLFEVTDGVYQVRGYDLANMTIIEGDKGWILVDPLTARETASRAFLFAREHLGNKPVTAILFTHSHLDHFGGVQGILDHLSEDELDNLKIVAPAGFEDEATSENIIAGPAMSRRAMYMYGKRLARNARGHVDTGLGKAPAFGSFGYAEPTELIMETGTELTIDGVPFVFQLVSGSEAPSEFTFYLPEQKAFCGAELVSRNLHNLYTLRGAKVRDARQWSAFIEEARTTFSGSDVYFGSHHWPIWGHQRIDDFLAKQRDTYRFIHDQSVRMMNQGYTPDEVAENLALPSALNEEFHNQGYYGTVKHNARAVYQFYLGWYTGNPSTLDPLPGSDSAGRYLAMMGGMGAVLDKARAEFDEAAYQEPREAVRTYRWLAELLNHAVFAVPDNAEAKGLLANVYDQLGYQAESGPWRDIYLTGAYELRHGGPDRGINLAAMKEVLLKTPVVQFFDSLAVRLDADKAEGESMTLKVTFSDLGESYLLILENSVLNHRLVEPDTAADTTLTLTRPLFVDIMVGEASLDEVLLGDDLSVEGSKLGLLSFFSMFDRPDGTFNIVLP